MQRILPATVLVTVIGMLAACGRTPMDDAPLATADDPLVGLLQYADPADCPASRYCGPAFSLLNETLDRWTPLDGDLQAVHHNRVISIDGRVTSIDEEDREWFGDAAAPRAIDVRRYRLLSEIPYHSFLVEQASGFTTQKYGCDLLWDKSFRWQRVDGRIHYVVRMTDTFSDAQPRPYLELTYDGTTGHFLAEDMQPWGMNPCDS